MSNYASIQQGQSGLTIYAVIRQQSGMVWNGSAFENYTSADWLLYVNLAIEQAGSGYYTVSLPSTLPAGTYNLSFYQQAGVTPSLANDMWLGSSTQTIVIAGPTPIAPGSSLAALITDIRETSFDGPTDNFIPKERLAPAIPLVYTNFRLQFQNIIIGSVYVTYDSNFRIQTGFTVDLTNGIITFNPAITPVNPSTLVADYNFQWFTDAQITNWLYDAANFLQQTDPTLTPAGLLPAQTHFALHDLFKGKAAEYARRYASSGGGHGQSIEVVSKQYLSLSEDCWKTGIAMRDDYYKRSGQRNAPASSTQTYGIDPYSPMR